MLCYDLDRWELVSVYFQFSEFGFAEKETSSIIQEAYVIGQRPQGLVPNTFDMTHSLAVWSRLANIITLPILNIS